RASTLEAHVRNDSGASRPYELEVSTWGEAVRAGTPVGGELRLGHGALFHLPLAAGEMVELLASSEQFDPRLDLWDPDGNVVAQADDRSLVDRAAFHRFLATRSGTWHVLVHAP